eukprot:TRINITY_DN76_c0_g1_i5.p2 TRINITY_DN76_c0_g1~~TRINITY_DN76_c0_g1_i5.p2  ORF type:complete len:498 (+),score=31.06 TRINITY_DN76_c0_g1_i5:1761-3254(+)
MPLRRDDHGKQSISVSISKIEVSMVWPTSLTAVSMYPGVNAWRLPVGSNVTRHGWDGEYKFLGSVIDGENNGSRSIFEGTNGDIKSEVLDPRYFSIAQAFTDPSSPSKVRNGVADLIRRLKAKCSQQTIRGVPLLRLLYHLTFDKGLLVTIVGGAVRDTLRRIPSHEISDIDICVGGISYFHLNQALLDFFAKEGLPLNDSVVRAQGKYKKFGMIKVMNDPSCDADDLDIGIMKAGIHPSDADNYLFGWGFARDALTRDYTINAIYVDVCNEVVYDPTQALILREDQGHDHNSHQNEDGDWQVTQTLRSAPLALANILNLDDDTVDSIINQDVGGQFRLFKELNKHVEGHLELDVDNDTREKVLSTIRTTAANIQIGTEAPDKWVRKIVKKLFGTASSDQEIRVALNKLQVQLVNGTFTAVQGALTSVLEQSISTCQTDKCRGLFDNLRAFLSGIFEILNAFTLGLALDHNSRGMFLDFSTDEDRKIYDVLVAFKER